MRQRPQFSDVCVMMPVRCVDNWCDVHAGKIARATIDVLLGSTESESVCHSAPSR